MENLDQTIDRLEKLYENITGTELPANEVRFSIATAEVDPIVLLDQRLQTLTGLLQDPAVQRSLQPWAPSTSVWENEDKIIVHMDVAGVRKEDVDLNIQADFLVVNGKRRNMSREAGFQPRMVEIPNGPFARLIPLPAGVSTSEISSKIESGILEILIPKNAKTGTGPRGKKSKSDTVQ